MPSSNTTTLETGVHRSLGRSDNLGVIGNFACLLGEATAPYVALCDQDDFWEPHKLRVLLKAMHGLEERHGTHNAFARPQRPQA